MQQITCPSTQIANLAHLLKIYLWPQGKYGLCTKLPKTNTGLASPEFLILEYGIYFIFLTKNCKQQILVKNLCLMYFQLELYSNSTHVNLQKIIAMLDFWSIKTWLRLHFDSLYHMRLYPDLQFAQPELCKCKANTLKRKLCRRLLAWGWAPGHPLPTRHSIHSRLSRNRKTGLNSALGVR